MAKTGGGGGNMFAKEAEAVDLLSMLDCKAFLKGMCEEKWKARKDAIEELCTIAGKSARLKGEGCDYGELVAALKKALKDSNMAVVAAAIRALGECLLAFLSCCCSLQFFPFFGCIIP